MIWRVSMIEKPLSKGISSYLIFSFILLGLLTFITWQDTKDYYFPSADHLGHLPYLKIESIYDFIKVLTEPVAADLFPEIENHIDNILYRPIWSLSFAADYHLSGLDPRGYHITDFILHWLCATILLMIVISLPTGSKPIAFLTGALFVIQPLHINTVPVPVRRAELLLGITMGLGLFFLIRHLNMIRKQANGKMFSLSFILSIIFGLLAFFTKPTALPFPALIFLFTFLLLDKDYYTLRQRAVKAFFHVLPFAVACLVYLALRWQIIGGLGGYQQSLNMPIYIRLAMGALAFVAGSSYLILPFLPIYPSLFHIVSKYPLATIIGAALFLGPISCYIYLKRAALIEALSQPIKMLENERLCEYFALFGSLFLLMSIYVLLGVFSPWYSYVLLMFISAIMAYLFEDALNYLRTMPWRQTADRFVNLFQSLTALLLILYCVVIFIASPLFTAGHRDWQEAGEICREMLEKTDALIAELPQGSHFYLLNYPAINNTHVTEWNHVLGNDILYDYTVEGYFKMKYPDKSFRFRGLCYSSLFDLKDIKINTEFQKHPQIHVYAEKGSALELPFYNFESKTKEKITGQWQGNHFEIILHERDETKPPLFFARPVIHIEINMKTEETANDNHYFLVYDGKGIIVYNLDDLGWIKAG